MRRFDKKQNIKKANLLAESMYLNRGSENLSEFDYASAESEYADKQDYESMGIEEFIGTEMNMKKILINVHHGGEEKMISGIFSEVDMSEGTPLLKITMGNKPVAFVMYNKSKNEFVEGMSSWYYKYEAIDAQTGEVFEKLKTL
jgi:hypothetical protein